MFGTVSERNVHAWSFREHYGTANQRSLRFVFFQILFPPFPSPSRFFVLEPPKQDLGTRSKNVLFKLIKFQTQKNSFRPPRHAKSSSGAPGKEISHWLLKNKSNNCHFAITCYCMFAFGWLPILSFYPVGSFVLRIEGDSFKLM